MPYDLVRSLYYRTALGAVLLVVGLNVPAQAADAPQTLVSLGSAFITQEGTPSRWSIGNRGVALSVGLTPSGGLAVLSLERPGRPTQWSVAQSAEVSFHVGAKHLIPGQGDFLFRQAKADDVEGSVRLALVFESASAKVRATRTYACYPGAPAIEAWTTLEPYQTSSNVTLSDIGVWEVSVDGTEINWVTGVKTTAADGGAFTRKRAPLSAGLQIGATGRSTSTNVPLVWVDGPAGHFFAGLIWSGAWSITASPLDAAGRSTIRASLGSIETTLGAGVTVETPHGFYGVARDGDGDVPRALSNFIMVGVRHGRPFAPLVSYDTWYAYGIKIDEATLRAQMELAASLGAELFVVDAGWYTGGIDVSDFSTGIGQWTADPKRFPSGLRALGDYAHGLGMKFGIWMEPERVDVKTANRPGLVRESWLATSGGRYDPKVKTSSFAQICLASREARQWVVDQVSRVIAESGADYLKWDNNFWINCDRSGHGHGAKDGNLAHHLGLYNILSDIRVRFPDVIIENCAEGGNRLDLGMMRFTDTAWMDDVTSPSTYVRHNLEGLGAIYPPAYLLSFVKDDRGEPIHGADDMPLYFRSRMPGVLGFSLRAEEFSDSDIEQMTQEIALYKATRDTLVDASMLLLTSQSGEAGGDGWDAVELLSASTGNAVVYGFAGFGASDGTIVRLQNLDRESLYVIRLAGGEGIGSATGRELMMDGIGLIRQPVSAATVLVLTRQDSTHAPGPHR